MINVETNLFVAIYAVLLRKLFFCHLRWIAAKSILSRFMRFCVKKNLLRNCACGEKRTNMRYGLWIMTSMGDGNLESLYLQGFMSKFQTFPLKSPPLFPSVILLCKGRPKLPCVNLIIIFACLDRFLLSNKKLATI